MILVNEVITIKAESVGLSCDIDSDRKIDICPGINGAVLTFHNGTQKSELGLTQEALNALIVLLEEYYKQFKSIKAYVSWEEKHENPKDSITKP